jgi:uncharacterized cysteine cluster protein YcgN (CxxCxxCC family)
MTDEIKAIKTPELDKMKAVQDKSQTIGWFLDTCGYDLAEYDDDHMKYFPINKNIEQILAEFFNIDLNKIENERRQLLDAIREAQQ